MQRAASTPSLGASPAEDNLSYAYAPNTNRLLNVSDAGVAASSGKKAHYFNDRNTSGSDYAYDAAGNLVKDLNRDINYIGYNVLGLPEEIRFTNNAKIFYLYTASGAKLQKQGAYLPGATPGSILQKKIDYLAAGVFADNALTFIPTAEGRALPPNTALGGTAFRYEYQQTDHLDNLRTACRCAEKLDSLGNVVALLPSDNLRNLVQENAYDPWGLNLPDLERSAVLPDWWQFSTKERDYRAYDEFEFRHYDAAIGRFMSIDPLFQQFRGISPFNYADNNPSTFIDLYGLQSGPSRITTQSSGNIGAGSSGGGSTSSQGPSFGLGGIGNVVGTLVFNYYVNKKINEPRDNALEALNASPNVRLAQQKASFSLNERLAAAGWQPGQPIPAIDGILPDYTLAGAYVGTKVLTKPLEYLARPLVNSLRFQWTKYTGNVANNAVENYAEGSFSIFKWESYPAGGVRPNGPFRLIEGAEYTQARNLANSTNAAMRRADPTKLKGLQIHEVHPVKFGGSPTDLSNKIFISPSEHAPYTNYWNALMRNIK